MERGLIGVLVETGDRHLLDVLSPEKAKKALAHQGDVMVLDAPSWNGPHAADRIERLCDEKGLSRIVICGPSSETSTLPEWLGRIDAGAPPVPVTYAAIREHCAWVEKDKAKAEAKGERLLKMAVAGARGATIPIFKEVPVERTVAVIGSNHAAYQMAACLIHAGFPVLLLKTESPSGCFYPLPESLVQDVSSSSAVRLVEEGSLHQVEGCVGSYRLELTTTNGREAFTVGAIVLAVDAQTDNLRLEGLVEENDRVMSLREYGERVSAGQVDSGKVCIWLDRGGPERRCAGQAALRYAIEHAHLGGKPTVLYSHMPVYGHRGQVLCDRARTAGVEFINYNGRLPRIDASDRGLAVTVTDSVLPHRVLEFHADHLVVPASIRPSTHNGQLAKLFRQPLDVQGYLQSGNVRHRPVGSARRGVFFVGSCHDECDPEEAHVEALAVQAELLALLPEGTVKVPSARVVVDPAKCAQCLTCLRSCPHGAIQLSPSRRRMEVLDPACYQCGICAASCPGSAIEHSSLRSAQMRDILEVATEPMFGRPPIIAFACSQSAIPAASGAGRAGLTLPSDVLLVEVPCAGLVGENLILDALWQGARGVLVLGCHHDNCRSLWGTDLTNRRVLRTRTCLEEVGVDAERVRFYSFAANESHRLAHVLAQAAEELPAEKFDD